MPRQPFSLFVFIDALGWRLFQRYGLLADILKHSQPVESVLGYSCACDPTILTGTMPDVHGHWSFFCRSAGASPFQATRWLQWLPKRLTDCGRVRNVLSRLVARQLGFSGYFHPYQAPLHCLDRFDYAEKRDLYQPGGILGGVPTIFDLCRDHSVPFILSDWRKDEVTNLGHMEQGIRGLEARFGYLYLAGLDGVLHRYGTSDSRVRQKLQWYEEQIRHLWNVARDTYGEEMRLFVISDHGMSDTRDHWDIQATLSKTGLKFGTDYLAVFDSTMARFWYENDRAENIIDAVLAEQATGAILSETSLREYEVYFDDHRFGERIFLCHPGTMLSPSFMNRSPVAGMHGYCPRQDDSLALLASSHTPAVPVHRLDDIFGLMESEAIAGKARPRLAHLGDQPASDHLTASLHRPPLSESYSAGML